MRIGIACYSSVGGSGALAAELGKQLSLRGHEVHFISDGIPFRLGDFQGNVFLHEVEPPHHDVFRYPPFELALACKMADLIKTHSLEVLHAHYAVPFAVAAYLAKEMCGGCPVQVVTTLHGTDITLLARGRAMYDAVRLGVEKSDAVTAVSMSLAEDTKRLFGSNKTIEIIYNFVDTVRYTRRDMSNVRRHYASPGEPILVHISNFRSVKRVPDVVRVFAGVRNTRPAKLILVGEGPEVPLARSLVRELGVEQDVYFVGTQQEVVSILSMSDVMLLPSEKESFGLAAIEAMACETPVVATAVGGLPEVVVHGETGFLTEVGDISSMIDYVNALLEDGALHRAFAKHGRERVEACFSSAGQVLKYEELYRTMVGGVVSTTFP
ncbi:MAG: N-acetyl-alpha-D-glucosaminyl L-malate synthase BshA [Kyrpidia sp.]|nr:N-acetyl-alpha-D-glucosaminyl L-malate synthase BshA [Kyrpidia sp.]